MVWGPVGMRHLMCQDASILYYLVHILFFERVIHKFEINQKNIQEFWSVFHSSDTRSALALTCTAPVVIFECQTHTTPAPTCAKNLVLHPHPHSYCGCPQALVVQASLCRRCLTHTLSYLLNAPYMYHK